MERNKILRSLVNKYCKIIYKIGWKIKTCIIGMAKILYQFEDKHSYLINIEFFFHTVTFLSQSLMLIVIVYMLINLQY